MLIPLFTLNFVYRSDFKIVEITDLMQILDIDNLTNY